jgi:CRP-like cAMP-binding protein
MNILSFVGERPDDDPKTFDWKSLLFHHPAFSCLGDAETDALLRPEASRERVYAAGSLIVRQGESGDAVFLIGSGSAQVLLEVDGTRATLCPLRKADIFGEAALLEGSSRVTTVSAVQECLLLEIRGDVFRELLASHPTLELAILLKMTERLRSANEQILALKLKGGDEALKLLDARLSAEVRVFDASLRASQAVFEQTKIRADEVITSAERARTRLTFMTSSVGAVVASALAVLGFLGVKGMWDLKQLEEQIGVSLKTVREFQAKSEQLTTDITFLQVSTTEAKTTFAMEHLLPSLNDAVDKNSPPEALHRFEILEKLIPLDDRTLFDLVSRVEQVMPASPSPCGAHPLPDCSRQDYRLLLARILKYETAPRARLKAYSLLLANAILIKQERFEDESFEAHSWDDFFSRFQAAARQYKGQLGLKKEEWLTLESYLRKEKPDKLPALQRAKALFATT